MFFSARIPIEFALNTKNPSVNELSQFSNKRPIITAVTLRHQNQHETEDSGGGVMVTQSNAIELVLWGISRRTIYATTF